MNTLERATLSVAAPYLIEMVGDIIADAVRPEGVIEFRDTILDYITDFAKETSMSFDDNVAKVASEKILTVENFVKWGRQLLDWARQYVKHTLTKFDDLCLPIIDLLDGTLMQAALTAKA